MGCDCVHTTLTGIDCDSTVSLVVVTVTVDDTAVAVVVTDVASLATACETVLVVD